jgi:hypothetical protein
MRNACAAAVALTILMSGQLARAGCNFNANNIEYGWSENGYDTKMFPIDDNFCWLVELQGSWSAQSLGSNLGVAVQVENDGYWHIVTYRSGDYGYAYCAPASCFTGEGNYTVDWDNKLYPNDFWNESEISDTCEVSGCDHESNNNGWPGISGTASSLTMLQGWPILNGATNGNGEGAGVTENAGGPNTIWTNSCVSDEACDHPVQAVFSSIFVGQLGTTVPVYPYITAWCDGTSSFELTTTGASGICFLTEAEGGFRGSSVRTYLDSSGNWWIACNQASGYEIVVNYACMAYQIDH